MRALPLLLSLFALGGCRAHTHYFRGVDRSLFDEVELEPMDPEVSTSEAVALVKPPTAPAEPAWLEPAPLTTTGLNGRAEWSPDGKRILFQSVRVEVDEVPWEQVWLMEADGSKQRRLTMGVGKTHGAVMVPGPGFTIAYGSTHHLGVTPPRDTPAIGDSADAQMELFAQDLMTGAFTPLAEGPGFDGEPHFCAPDTFAFSSGRDGDREVFLSQAGVLRQITDRAGADESPRLAPDCSSLVWVRHQEAGTELVRLSLAGGLPETVVSTAGTISAPSWSPDGSAVLFASDLLSPGAARDLFVASSAGLRRLTSTDADEDAPRLSPDGARLLYVETADLGPQLVAAPFSFDVGAPMEQP